MSDEEFKRRLAAMEITPEMADECASRLIAGAFRREDKRPKFTIPTRHDDDDIVIVEFIKRAAALAEENKGLRIALQKTKLIALTAGGLGGLDTHDGLSRIVRICLDAGIDEKISELRAALEPDPAMRPSSPPLPQPTNP